MDTAHKCKWCGIGVKHRADLKNMSCSNGKLCGSTRRRYNVNKYAQFCIMEPLRCLWFPLRQQFSVHI